MITADTGEICIQIFTTAGWTIPSLGLDIAWVPDVVSGRLTTGPLQSGLPGELIDAVQVPAWFGQAMKMLGLCVLILGMIGWVLSPSMRGRRRGFQFAVSGLFLTVLGIAFVPFQKLITYVLNG